MGNRKQLRRLESMTAALVGVFFFFAIVGLFGLKFAIVGLAVFVLGALLSASRSRPRVRNNETRSFYYRQNSVCLYGELSHHFSDDVDRPCFLPGRDRGPLAED